MKLLLESCARPKKRLHGAFFDAMRANGYTVMHRGWPDFVVYDQENDDIFVVEIQSSSRPVYTEKAAIMEMFLRHGIPYCRWTPALGLEQYDPSDEETARINQKLVKRQQRRIGRPSRATRKYLKELPQE